MTPNIDAIVAAARTAAGSEHPSQAVRQVLRDALVNPVLMANEIDSLEEDDYLWFEDDSVSIWTCRFQNTTIVPPHNHKMDVYIGVFRGTEDNILYRREENSLKRISRKQVSAGEMLSLGGEGIHAVTAAGTVPSLAVHVYLGPLTKIERSLFDWESGVGLAFTDENYDRLKKPAAEMASL